MSSHPSAVSPAAPEGLLAESITYGAVHLDVVDMERSLAFWRELIGLGELPSPAGEARLGVEDRALVVLHPDASRPAARGHAGLYHLAIHLPNETEFARILARLAQTNVPQSPTDHIFSKATYLHDPDGIMLELTLETPERCRSIEIGAHTVSLIDSDGRRRGPTEPLDFAAAIAPLHGGDPQMGLASGSYVGHVHLHVPDLQRAFRFYRDVIGFQEHAYMPPVRMADLSAGGTFPHRLALNDWHGPAARQAPSGTAGLRRYELILRGSEELDGLAARAASADVALSRGDGLVCLQDPAGNEISVTEATG